MSRHITETIWDWTYPNIYQVEGFMHACGKAYRNEMQIRAIIKLHNISVPPHFTKKNTIKLPLQYPIRADLKMSAIQESLPAYKESCSVLSNLWLLQSGNYTSPHTILHKLDTHEPTTTQTSYHKTVLHVTGLGITNKTCKYICTLSELVKNYPKKYRDFTQFMQWWFLKL